jgi:hypothetical protein
MLRRASIAVVIALVATLVVVPLATGKNGKPQAKGKNKFELVGTVVSPAAGDKIVVKVKSGTKTVRAYRGKELELTVASNAKLMNATVDPHVAATIDAFVAGSKVHVSGTIDRADQAHPVFTATKLILQKLPVAP